MSTQASTSTVRRVPLPASTDLQKRQRTAAAQHSYRRMHELSHIPSNKMGHWLTWYSMTCISFMGADPLWTPATASCRRCGLQGLPSGCRRCCFWRILLVCDPFQYLVAKNCGTSMHLAVNKSSSCMWPALWLQLQHGPVQEQTGPASASTWRSYGAHLQPLGVGLMAAACWSLGQGACRNVVARSDAADKLRLSLAFLCPEARVLALAHVAS